MLAQRMGDALTVLGGDRVTNHALAMSCAA
jgi:hypothetical protein